MNDAPPVLKALQLTKSYRVGASRLEVLRGVDVELRPGEVRALMGASGSGKSTLLNLLGLLDKPDSGKLLLNGREVQNLGRAASSRTRASSVGFVFQQFQLLPELSALENVLLPRRLLAGWNWWGRRGNERRAAREALGMVGLGKRLRHRPAQLSGGEQQRVAIARALICQPPILLADEPTGNLDRGSSEEVLELLLRLGREMRSAVLIATHDSDVSARCDSIVTMSDGLVRLAEPA